MRFVLAVVAIVLAVAAVWVFLVGGPTTTTTVTPEGAITPITQTVNARGSDNVVLGLLGFGAVFGFVTIFYNRISSIAGPGFSFQLTPRQQKDAKEAAATAVSTEFRPPPPAGAKHPPETARGLVQYAAFTNAGITDDKQREQATKDLARKSADVSLYMMDDAQALLLAAQISPAALKARMKSFGVKYGSNEEHVNALLKGDIDDDVWSDLATHALTELGISS